MEKESSKVKSLAKALHVLECFDNDKPELGVTEIAKMLHLQKSTVHNIVSTYKDLGYLQQNPETGKYYLGIKLLQFSYIINNHMGLRKFFLPYLQEIANKVNETVYLGIPHDGDVMYIENQAPSSSTSTRNILGEHAPMYCTGLGKVMLAFLSDADREAAMDRPFLPFTENTITTREALLAELAEIRRRGYAIDNMEHEYGVICIAFPVFGVDGRIVAAISASAPSLRFTPEVIKQNAVIMREILAPAQRIL